MQNEEKPLVIRVSRKKTEPPKKVPEDVSDPGSLKQAVIPENTDLLDEKDEQAVFNLVPSDGEMMLFSQRGNSLSLRDTYKNSHGFLILSGPSLNNYDLSLLKGTRGCVTMGVNNSWSVFKPNLWVCLDDPKYFLDIGWKDPSITKFSPISFSFKYLGLKAPDGSFVRSSFRVNDMPSVFYFKRNLKFRSKSFLDEPTVNWGSSDKVEDEVGCKGGRSVMLAAIKIMYYLGFRNIYLLGADFKMEQGKQNYAFAQDRSEKMVKGNNGTYSMLNRRFVSLLPEFNEKGLKIYNCNKESGLVAFPYMSYEDAVNNATATFKKPIDTTGWYEQYEKDEAKEKAQEQDKKPEPAPKPEARPLKKRK